MLFGILTKRQSNRPKQRSPNLHREPVERPVLGTFLRLVGEKERPVTFLRKIAKCDFNVGIDHRHT